MLFRSDCPFVNKKLIADYRAIAGIDGSGRYRMIYKIMTSIACTAVKRRYPITSGEVAELVAHAKRQIAGRMVLMTGAGQNSTAATVARASAMSALGVDALLVVTPAYNKPTQEGLYLHYAAVAAASSVPVMLYNVPGRTAVDLSPDTVARLASVPRIAAIKEAVADLARVRELLAKAPGIDVLSGDDATARETVLAGAKGVVSVTANVAPRPMAEMIVDQAREVIAAIVPAGMRVDVALVWDPPWTPERMSGIAREHFGWK